MNTHFGMHGCLILPMQWGVQPIGVLLVNAPNIDSIQLQTLEAIVRQAAVTIGMMSTRLRRAKERTVQEERARIGMEIHDTISQSLFGIVYTLDGSLKLLDKDPGAIRSELEWAVEMAEEARKKLRHVIHDVWTEKITAEAFEADIRHYANDVLQATSLQIEFDVRGSFGDLSPDVWRSLYRICQESLTNVVHRAAATHVHVCLDVEDGRAWLIVRDNGRGFETALALAQEYGQEHFGLRGIQDRARSLGGTCDIFSQHGEGTSIVVDLPANAHTNA